MEKLLKKCILLLIIELCYFATAVVAEQNSEKASNMPIFIDSRLLVLAHPLFKAFDPKTQRFKGTSSESFQEDFDSRFTFIQATKDLEDELLKSPERLKERLKGVPFKDRINVEREFLLEKKLKESKLEYMKRRIYLSRLVPTKDGMTPYMSIYPQCRDLADCIRKVTDKLKKKYNTEVVIDIANILPYREKIRLMQLVLENNMLNEAYNKESKFSSEDFTRWFDAANSYWASKLGMDADIIPVGAKDVRLEAIKLIEEEGKGYKLWN